MKPDIHPRYRTVLFHDTSANTFYTIGSTITTERTHEYEGKIYPYVTVEVSAASHPYYTGKQKEYSKEGSAARFQKRFGHFLKS